MIVMGLDPGTVKCGWAIFRIVRGTLTELVKYGVERATESWKLDKRIRHIHDLLRTRFEEEKPRYVGIEGGVFRYASAALALGEMRGAAKAAAWAVNAETMELAPQNGKQALTGDGSAKKPDMIRFVKLLYNKTVLEDEADAIGIGLAAANRIIARDILTVAEARRK